MLDFTADITDDLIEFELDEVGLDAKIPVGCAVVTGPLPNGTKHSTVQSFEKHFVDNLPLATESPHIRSCNVLLFEFV